MEKNKTLRVCTFSADIVSNPKNDNVIDSNDSQLLYGEEVELLKVKDNHVYCRSLIDNYEGYILKDNLSPINTPATHFIDTLLTHIYPAPSFKVKPISQLSFLSRIAVLPCEPEDGFIKLENNHWIFHSHIRPLDQLNGQCPIQTALKFVGVPYLYGGRSAHGIDCSALIQLAALRNGRHQCPRDSKDQLKMLDDKDDQQNIGKGDIVFFPGHVGIMVDDDHLLNATARQMKVVIEPLEKVKDAYTSITSIKSL